MTDLPMTGTELEVSAERCARALLAGYTGTPRLDPMALLGAELPQIPPKQQGEWLALVASAATAMLAGTLTALRLRGVDTQQAQARIALARETAITEQEGPNK